MESTNGFAWKQRRSIGISSQRKTLDPISVVRTEQSMPKSLPQELPTYVVFRWGQSSLRYIMKHWIRLEVKVTAGCSGIAFGGLYYGMDCNPSQDEVCGGP